MSELKVTIKGVAGAGKTVLAHKIAAWLEAEGVTTTITDEDRLQPQRYGQTKFLKPVCVNIKVKKA